MTAKKRLGGWMRLWIVVSAGWASAMFWLQHQDIAFNLKTYFDGFYYMQSDTNSWVSGGWFIADEGGHVYRNNLNDWVFQFPNKTPTHFHKLTDVPVSKLDFDAKRPKTELELSGMDKFFEPLISEYDIYLKQHKYAVKWFNYYEAQRVSVLQDFTKRALVPPVILFVVGYLLGWVVRGFKR